MMTGNIIHTSSGYTIQINVTDTSPNAKTLASFSGTFTEVQITNHSAINQASSELLIQMGVQLTNSAKKELNKASSSEDRQAQIALAQGIVAQRKGQIPESISYYLNAASFEATSTEALSRMSLATNIIATGSLGTQIRNDIQQRNEWIKLINETNNFFINNPQYSITELYYNSELNLSSINYIGETASLVFPIQVRINNEKTDAIIKVITDIQNGLNATGRRAQWGIGISIPEFIFSYTFDFELLNDKGRIISTTRKSAGLMSTRNKFGLFLRDNGQGDDLFIRFMDGNITPIFFHTVGSVPDNFLRQWTGLNNRNYNSKEIAQWVEEPTFIVKASNITDTLTIRLKNITVSKMEEVISRGLYSDAYLKGYLFYRVRFSTIKRGYNIIPVFMNKI